MRNLAAIHAAFNLEQHMNRLSDPRLDSLVPLGTQASTLRMPGAEEMAAMIERSHKRSAAYGLQLNGEPDLSLSDRTDFTLLLEKNRSLCTYALPVMESLYEQIVNTHSMAVLTDARGMVLHSLGDDDFLEKAERIAMKPGVTWSEQSMGTNAIGTAIAEGLPTLVHGGEHYLRANHFITCSAAPIFDHQGELIGVLDVTGDSRSFHRHTLALVRMSAQMIENQLFSAASRDAIALHFHTRAELIGTLMEGIVSFTPDGHFMSANRAALSLLAMPRPALQSHTFSSLFDVPLSALFEHHRSAASGLLALPLDSTRVFARTELRLDSRIFRHKDTHKRAAPESRTSGLAALNTGDPKLAMAIEKVTKVLGRGIPILVMGETGTGKDLFAQAMHHDSPDANGPFVAVNCAAIPETLIESELFGYEDGAFTGARKSGNIGKILQANKGTLFLDEIGDMPLHLQARLLRTLQERTVTPLGSNKSIPVDFSLVCATNRNLRDLIAKGLFREDLYYRLNGLVIKLPPLRERTDIEKLTRKVLANESNGGDFRISAETMEHFKRYPWPGNVRQLVNLLRTAIVMADDDHEIRREHLSDDFLEEVGLVPEVEAARFVAHGPAVGTKLGDVEISMIRKTLDAHGGNVSAAARVLGVSRNTIYRKLQGQR